MRIMCVHRAMLIEPADGSIQRASRCLHVEVSIP
jgi:hypothetical protein